MATVVMVVVSEGRYWWLEEHVVCHTQLCVSSICRAVENDADFVGHFDCCRLFTVQVSRVMIWCLRIGSRRAMGSWLICR